MLNNMAKMGRSTTISKVARKSRRVLLDSSRLQQRIEKIAAKPSATADILKKMTEKAKKLSRTARRAEKQKISQWYILALTIVSRR